MSRALRHRLAKLEDQVKNPPIWEWGLRAPSACRAWLEAKLLGPGTGAPFVPLSAEELATLAPAARKLMGGHP